MKRIITSLLGLALGVSAAMALNPTLQQAQKLLANATTVDELKRAKGQFAAAKSHPSYTASDQKAINNGITQCNSRIKALTGNSRTTKPAATSAAKPRTEAATLMVNGSTTPSFSLASEGGSRLVSLSTNQGWPDVYDTPGWLVADVVSADQIELGWDPNNTRKSRSATFRVTAGAKTVKVTVTQGPGDYKLQLTDIKYANSRRGDILTEPGNPLFADEMRFLTPELHYDGGSKDEDHVVQVKIFNPNGNLRQASYSPEDYTFDYPMTFYKGDNQAEFLKGLGRSDVSTFEAGRYRVEVYLDHNLALVDNIYINSNQGYASYLTVNNDTYAESLFDADGESHDFQVRTDGTWAMAGVPAWCEAYMKGDVLTVTAKPNADNSPRYDTMTVKSGDRTVTIGLHQAGK